MQLEKMKQASEVTAASASEIDKIKAVIDQSTKGFEPSNFVGRTPGIPNEHYVCKRCNQKGHFVGNCPNVAPEDRVVEPRYKRTTGIPSTMLTIVDDPLHPGALLTTMGQFAVPTVDVLGYKEVKREKPPFLPGEKQPEPEKKKIPQELLCHICEDLCVDAAIAPCCGTSFCDECLREELLESDDHQCPSCKETNVSPDRIVANRSMRMAVNNFLNDTGYTKVKRRRSSSHSGGDHPSIPAATSPVPDTSPAAAVSSAAADPAPPTSTPSQAVMSSGLSIPQLSHHSSGSGRFPSHSGPRHRPPYSDRYYNKHPNPRYSSSSNSYGAYNHALLSQFPKPWQFQQAAAAALSYRADEKQQYPHQLAASHLVQSAVVPHRSSSDVSLVSPMSVSDGSGDGNKNNSNASWPPLLPTTEATSAPSVGTLQSVPASQPSVQPAALTGFAPPSGHQAGSYYPVAQATTAAVKKPVDVFDSFADYTRKRSRSPERRRSRTRSPSTERNKQKSWSPSPSRSKHKLSPRPSNVSPGKRTSQSYTPRRSTSPGGKRASSRSLSPRRLSERRSRSRSRSQSLDHLTRSRTRSRSRPRSITPPRNSSKLRSPRVRSSLSPLPRRVSGSPSRQASDSPQPHKSLKSAVLKTSKSPQRRLTPPLHRSSLSPLRRSPLRRRSKSPLRGSSKSPLRRSSKSPLRKSRSPYRRSSKSPFRRLSKSPVRRSSKSPLGKSKSPYRRSSKSPLRRYSKSPLRRSSKSPLPRRLSNSPVRRSSKSPIKKSSKSPLRRSLSPYRRSSKSPFRRYSSKSPPRQYSKSPVRRSSLSPRRRSSKSPLPSYRGRSRSRSYRRSRSKSYSRRPRSYSRPRSPRPYSSLSPRRSPLGGKNRSPSPHRKRSQSPFNRRSRSRSPGRKSPLPPLYRSRSRSLSRHKYSPKYRSRSPVPQNRRSLTPLSPGRSKSPYKKPLSPPRRSLSPRRDRGGYAGRGRGGMGRDGYRNFGRDKFQRSPPRDGLQPHNLPPADFNGIPGNLPPVPYFPTMGLPPPEEYFRNDPAGYQEFVRSLYSQWAQSQGFPPLPVPPGAGLDGSSSNFPVPPAASSAAVGGNPFQQGPPPPGPPGGSFRPHGPAPLAADPLQQRPPWEQQAGPGSFNNPHHHPGPRDRRGPPPRDYSGGRPWDRDRINRDRDRYERDRENFKRSDKGRPYLDRPRDYDKSRDGDKSREPVKGKLEKGREGDKGKFAERTRDSERARGHDRGRETERHHRDADRRDKNKENEKSKSRDASRNEKDKSKDGVRGKEKTSLNKKKSPSRKGKEEEKVKSKKKPEKTKEESKKPKSLPEAQGKEENIEKVQKTSSMSGKELDKLGVDSNNPEQKLQPSAETKPVKGGNKDVDSRAGTGAAVGSTDAAAVAGRPEVKEKKVGAKKKGDGIATKKKKDTSTEDGAPGGTEKKVKKIKKKKLTFGASEVDSTKQGLKKKKLKRVVDYKSETMSEDGEDKAPLGRSPLKKSKLAQRAGDVEVTSQAKEEENSANVPDSSHVTSSEATSEDSKPVQLVSEDKVTTRAEEEHRPERGGHDRSHKQQDEQVAASDSTHGKEHGEQLPELPQLSKWEREDFDPYEAVDKPSKDVTPKKMMLPRSVVDKAEKFLIQKPMKNAVMVAHVTTSTKSPETSPEKPEKSEKADPEKPVDRQRSGSRSPKMSSRRVFVDNRRDSKDKKSGDLQITVKTSVSRQKGEQRERKRSGESDERKRSSSRGEDHRASHHHSHHYHHQQHNSSRESFEEDQRSVVKSRSLERELKEQKSKSQKAQPQEKSSKKSSKWKSSFSSMSEEKNSKDGKDISKKDISKEKVKGRSPSPPGSKHVLTSKHRESTDLEQQTSNSVNTTSSKSSVKDLRHRLDEKNKSKSAVEQRKLSVMDESEFVPDYEDLVPHGASDDAEQGEATSSHNSPVSSSNEKDSSKKRKREEKVGDADQTQADGEGEEFNNTNTEEEESSKPKKSKKKHKHKEKTKDKDKSKEKKEKHKHKKKKHKHKKSKEKEANE
ncbi:E3 ubiquitin-protein ligase RBBP6 [Elysia marginata]|uniref:E3 ubiquitin-protein ligase RBBP6 n=1 Tax=Elysia marginata TaxID=1093978 RepID=A0AAV4IDS3_9GAST|nr:E3 ubiquitin-protein ligase RBBP6 [Elysia marginata]